MNKLRVADHGPPSDIVRNRRFESISLQQRVQCEPDFPRPKSDANLDFQSFTGACRAGHPTVRRCGDVRLRALVKGSWLGSSVSLWAKPHPLASSYRSTLFLAPRPKAGLSARDQGFESVSLQRRVNRTPYPGARRAPPPARLGRRPNTIIVAGIGLKEMKPGSGGNLH